MNLYNSDSDDELTNPDKYFENKWNTKKNKFNEYINGLPNDTEYINIRNYGMPELPDLSRFHNLKNLHIDDNRIKTIPFLPASLTEFTCKNNLLEELPELPDNLLCLMCGENKLKQIPNLPEKLEILCCEFNEINGLPTFNKNLRKVHCNNNKLQQLPKFNEELVFIACNNNQITRLPKLNSKLEEINCGNNLLEHFPPLHSTLKYVYCDNNQIQNLPMSSEKLFGVDFNMRRTPICKKLNTTLVGADVINIINGFVNKTDVKEKTEICEICKINQSMNIYGLQNINICYDCKDNLLDKYVMCEGCDITDVELTDCEMCQKKYCVNCMYLFCFECKENYACFWCGSKFRTGLGIEEPVYNEIFRCKKHKLGFPDWKIEEGVEQFIGRSVKHDTKIEEVPENPVVSIFKTDVFRRYTKFDSENGEETYYLPIKSLCPPIITKTGDIQSYILDINTCDEFE